MSAIEFSKRAASNLNDSSVADSDKKKILEALQRARENPEEYLSPVTGHDFYRIDTDGRYVAIVGWDEDEDRIRFLSVGSGDEFGDE